MSNLFYLQFVFACLACLFYNASSSITLLKDTAEYIMMQALKDIDMDPRQIITEYTKYESYLLVSIETRNYIEYFPLLGTFNANRKCKKLRVILYNLRNDKFLVGNIKCNGNAIIKIKNGTLEIKADMKSVSGFSRRGFNFRSTSYKITSVFRSYSLFKIPRCPRQLMYFNRSIIPYNFNPSTDQQFVVPQQPIAFKGYYNQNTEITDTDIKNELTFAVFESKIHKYAVPIRKGCSGKVSDTVNIEIECEDNKYNYLLTRSILSIGRTSLFTNNVGGLKVIITKNYNNLLSHIKEAYAENCADSE